MSFIGKPTTYLDFGAVKINKFPKAIPCTSNADYCQPTTQDDDIAFQFEVSQSEELLTNGDFQNGVQPWLLIGWSITGVLNPQDPEKHVCQFSTSNLNGLVQYGVITMSDFYKITITVSNRTLGSISIAQSTLLTQTSNVIVSTNGTFTLFYTLVE